MVTIDQAGRGRRTLELLAPSAPLAALVEHLWVQRPSEVAPLAGRAWRIVPDDAPHLLWHAVAARDGVRHRLVLVGARSVFLDAETRDRLVTVGVRLRPGALPALVGLAASELTDGGVALADVAGRAARETADRLPGLAPYAVARHLERLLLHLARDRRPSARAAALPRLADVMPLDDVARTLGISPRTLRLTAGAELGLGARRIARIRRLHRALRLRLEGGLGWAGAGATAGYVDQAHLTHECRALLGETPGAFAARAVETPHAS